MRRTGWVFLLLPLIGCGPTTPTADPGVGPDDPAAVADLFYQIDYYSHIMDLTDPGGQDRAKVEKDIERIANENVEVLLNEVQFGDTERKYLAAFGLGYVPTKRKSVIPILALAMDDGGPQVRRMAAASLGRLKPDDPPREKFQKLLYDKAPQAREGSLMGLAYILSDDLDLGLLPDIQKCLKDDSVEVRNQAVITLSVVGSADSVEPLCQMLLREQSPHVRANAALTLRRIGTKLPEPREKESPLIKRMNKTLIDLLKDYNTDVVDFAYDALVQINGVVLNRAYAVWRDWYEETPPKKAPADGGR